MIPLRVRSSFSLRWGTASPAELCRRAKQGGYSALALTDRENLYGLWSFLAACRRESIRPIVGSEIAFGPLPDENRTRRLTLLVRSDTGYRNLCNIISRRKRGEIVSIESDSVESFQGLVVLTDCASTLKRCSMLGVSVAADLGSRPTEQGSRLRRQAAVCGVPAVATPDSDLADRNQIGLHRLLRAIDEGRVLGSEDTGGPPVEALEHHDVYEDRFAVWPEVLTATHEVAEWCEFSGPPTGLLMPPWYRAGRGSAEVTLHAEAFAGARVRYGEQLPDAVVDRLTYELSVIDQMGFSSYFLVVRDIVLPLQPDGTRKVRRICGRGSGAASLVAYCLGITNVCPVRHNLYFERFLNPGRSDPPDIDIDFAWDERDAVLDEVLSSFGNRAAMVCNHVCFKPRMAIRETARAYGLPGYEISRLTKRLPWFYRQNDTDLQEQIGSLPQLRDQDFSGPWGRIIAAAGELIGLPRYLSVHPGGVVITDGPVEDHVPVERAAKGVPIIQWEKDGAEEAGLVKIDLLGNRSLGVIRDAIVDMKRNNIEFSERDWHPEDDLQTRAAVSTGRTMGCFYIESPAMRLLQKKAGSGDFEQLVIQSSIIRPAANEFVREYVRRLHGGPWEPLHAGLETVLDETYGLMVYQEDVSRVAVALADFTHGEADGLRKVMSKKDRELRLKDYRDKFYAGSRRNGLTDSDIDRIWAMMMSFDGYSFCKPHSASYARVSFQAAYLKTHYPAEFMAAVISNQGGYYSTFAYVSEAKRMGLRIDSPDVCVSDFRWRGRGRRVRVGLQAVHNLSVETVRRLLCCREAAAFSCFGDFLQRVRPAEDEVRSLIDSGALDSLNLEPNRSVLFWEAAARGQKARGGNSGELFPASPMSPPLFEDPGPLDRLRREFRTLGFLCTTHPVSLIRAGGQKTVKGAELAGRIGSRVDFIGWLLTGKIVSTKTGQVMEFLTFEDDTAIIETTFFPDVYNRYAHILSSHKPYLLRGLVEEDYGATTLTVEKVTLLTNRR